MNTQTLVLRDAEEGSVQLQEGVRENLFQPAPAICGHTTVVQW